MSRVEPCRESERLGALDDVADDAPDAPALQPLRDSALSFLLFLPFFSLPAVRGDCSGDASAEPMRLGAIAAFALLKTLLFIPRVLTPPPPPPGVCASPRLGAELVAALPTPLAAWLPLSLAASLLPPILPPRRPAVPSVSSSVLP
jgi:hypothetical protein